MHRGKYCCVSILRCDDIILLLLTVGDHLAGSMGLHPRRPVLTLTASLEVLV
jgi:hypothetical protein